jgi:hypothetical protein
MKMALFGQEVLLLLELEALQFRLVVLMPALILVLMAD